MGKQLSERGILQEFMYDMDETGVLLSGVNTVKVLVSRSDVQNCRGVCLRRTMITAVECISADARFLPLLIIWPSKTLLNTWISHETLVAPRVQRHKAHILDYQCLSGPERLRPSYLSPSALTQYFVVILVGFKVYSTLINKLVLLMCALQAIVRAQPQLLNS